MFPEFLPTAVKYLQSQSAIALAQNIQRRKIATPLSQQKIATAYIQQGTGGTPILLLHGFDSSLLEYRSLIPLLAQNETWAVDLLGFGFTERPAGLSYSPDTIRTHLYCFWQALIAQPVILVGASMGGAAAIDFTLNYPQAVQKLVLINSVGYTGSFPLAQFLFPPLDSLAVEWWRQRKLQPLLLATAFGNWSPVDVEALRCANLHLEMPGWQEAFNIFTKSGGYSTLSRRIRQIDKPTLVLWGKLDDVLGTGDAEKFQRDIAGSQLVWLENCGHVPQIEQPQILAQHIRQFARETDK